MINLVALNNCTCCCTCSSSHLERLAGNYSVLWFKKIKIMNLQTGLFQRPVFFCQQIRKYKMWGLSKFKYNHPQNPLGGRRISDCKKQNRWVWYLPVSLLILRRLLWSIRLYTAKRFTYTKFISTIMPPCYHQ